MRLLLDALLNLPFHLMVASLALAVSALPVESADVELLVLTPENFDTTVSNGTWFIEHFSPYCHHCRGFLPTWEKLVQHYEGMKDPGVRLAQVNCAADGDLCAAHNVKGYPQMNLYKNGEFVDQFKGARDWDLLTVFIENHAERTSVLELSPSTSYSQPETVEAVESPTKETEAPASPVTNVPDTKVPNASGQVVALDSTTFSAALNEGPAFVKFYAPWCGHCKKLAPTWAKLATVLAGKLTVAEVNCDAHSALCKSQGVEGYPTLFFYSGGNGKAVHKTDYTGGRKLEQMQKFAETAIAPPVAEIQATDYDQIVKKNPVLYLFLHSDSDGLALNQVSQTAHILLGAIPVVSSTSPELRARFPLPYAYSNSPVLIAIKDGIANDYTALFPFSSTGEAAGDALAEWLLAHRLPTALELHQETFQDVMNAPARPLVVLVAAAPDGRGAVGEIVKNIGQEWRSERKKLGPGARDVVFAWMDADKWGSWMKSMYGIKSSELPAVVITDHQRLTYYDLDVQGKKIKLSTESILTSLEAALSGKLSYKHSENFVERMARALNDSLTSLETYAVTHPYRTGLLIVGVLVAFIIAVKRFIADDMPSYPRDHKKAPNRLD